uniref:Uncharacterized protein n=1 Tax=Anguilla anguilla TaxID=7936 RepID=A0A0E9XZP7_ANGAN
MLILLSPRFCLVFLAVAPAPFLLFGSEAKEREN